MRFFVSLFKNYRLYLDGTDFKREQFLASLNVPSESLEFVSNILESQMFHCFVVERVEEPDNSEVRFFDESIQAKVNRSKKTALTPGRRKETKFLDDTSHQVRGGVLYSH